jgi:hypothetical protein
MTEPTIEAATIAKLDLEDGDILVLRMPHVISSHDVEYIKRDQNEIIVLGEGASLEIVRQAAA